MGSSSRPRNSTPAKKAPSAKRTSPSGRRAASRTPTSTKPRVPAAIEIAIDEQRASLETTLSLLYCLHSALRREIDDAGRTESGAVEDASEEADLTHITEMLLVRLNSIHAALDGTALEQAEVDPEIVRLAEKVRELDSADEQEARHE